MSAREKSDLPKVAEKRANKVASAAAELAERRGGAKENAELQSTVRTQSRAAVSQAQSRIREAVIRNRRDKLTALLHHLTVDVLRASFFGLKKFAAPGVDEMTWTEYAKGLEENLADFRSRVQTGAYRALPSRRTYIPKPVRKRMRAKLREIKEQLMAIRHEGTERQGRWLRQVLRGWMAYYAVPMSGSAISAFRHHMIERWHGALMRRSQRRRWHLPFPRILHPWPEKRFLVTIQGGSPVR